MVLKVGQINLFNTVLQYIILESFKVVSLYQAYNAVKIPCPSHAGLVSTALVG